MSDVLADVTSNLESSKWHVYAEGWSRAPEIYATAERTAGGTLRPYVMRDTGGNIVKPDNYNYQIKLDETDTETVIERMTRLFNLFGKTVYVHNNIHDEGAHGSGYKIYFLPQPQGWDTLTSMLTLQRVGIMLQEIL